MTNNSDNFHLVESDSELSMAVLTAAGHVKHYPNLAEELSHLQPDDAFVYVSKTIANAMTTLQVVGLIEMNRIGIEMHDYSAKINMGDSGQLVEYNFYNEHSYLCRCVALLGVSLVKEIFTITYNLAKQSKPLAEFAESNGVPIGLLMNEMLSAKLLQLDDVEKFLLENPNLHYNRNTHTYM